jgi:hypothetical protein
MIKKKKCNKAITLRCTYDEPGEFLVCANMDRELGMCSGNEQLRGIAQKRKRLIQAVIR